MSADWVAETTTAETLPAMISSSTDLFDGEIFGDELIDIYNNTVEATNSQNQAEVSNLLSAAIAETKKEDEAAGMLSSIGDGLGAFRPSTSFNDLANLLNDPVEPKTKKRAPSDATAPAPKRKATDRRTESKDAAPEAKEEPKSSASVDPPAVAPKEEPKKPESDEKNLKIPEESSVLSSVAAAAVSKAPAPDSSDFKAIAQAAVSSLILSASGSEAPSKEKVDTSTAHIKALTGNNWVAACANVTSGIVQVDPKNPNRTRRQNLTPDERARQNRDRNREHARNTRLRKKAYVEELKRTLTELVAERDAAELEKRQNTQREMEQREVRFRVIEEFLKLRGRNETNFARWAAILEDEFTLTQPSSDVHKQSNEVTLTGVSDVMADANAFATLIGSLGTGENAVTCLYQCDRKNFFMDGCHAVLEWTVKTAGAVKNDASSELSFKGVIRGKFSPASNKLLSATITCDTGAILRQLPTANDEPDALSATKAEEPTSAAADALIDSLQVPSLPASVPKAVIVHPSSSSSSEGSCDDESDAGDQTKNGSSSLGMSLRSARK